MDFFEGGYVDYFYRLLSSKFYDTASNSASNTTLKSYGESTQYENYVSIFKPNHDELANQLLINFYKCREQELIDAADFACKEWRKNHGNPSFIEDNFNSTSVFNLDQFIGPKLGKFNIELNKLVKSFEALGINTNNDIIKEIRYFESINELNHLTNFIKENKVNLIKVNSLISEVQSVSEFVRKVKESFLEQRVIELFNSNEASFKASSQDILNNGLNSLKLMQTNGWNIDLLVSIIKSIKSTSILDFFKSVEVITHYNLSSKILNNGTESISDVFSKVGSDNWYVEIVKIAINQNYEIFKNVKNPETLFSETKDLNKDNHEVQDLINEIDQSDFLELIHEFEHQDSEIHPRFKVISEWTESDILAWKQELKVTEVTENLAETIAVIKQAVFLAYGFKPRDSQILSTLALFKANHGRLAQIETGEGKSVIISMFATLKSLEKKKVDIITSSSELAIRDSNENRKFYSIFGLTVANNIDENYKSSYEERQARSKATYEADIVYGNAISFIGDLLRDLTSETKVRANRPFDIIIVDEADNAFIDQNSHIPMLSRGMPGFEYLQPIFIHMWNMLTFMEQNIKYIPETKQMVYIEHEIDFEDESLPKGEDRTHEIPNNNVVAFIKSKLKLATEHLIQNQQSFRIPAHLLDFCNYQIGNWVNSLVEAKYNMVEKVHYDITTDKNGFKRISPISFSTTGEIERNTSWSDGVHQFIQIKHGLKLTQETLITSFMSNIGYFKRYGSNIFGLTGTLGTDAEKDLLASIYGVDFVTMPTYKPKNFIEYIPQLVENYEEWNNAVLLSVKKELSAGRAVLLICQTIREAENLAIELEKTLPPNKVKLYTRNESSYRSSVEEVLNEGEVIISTNLGSRGIHIKTSNEVKKNGNLHVCLTYLPDSYRVQMQVYGRTSREGESGTAQMIINRLAEESNLSLAYEWPDAETADDLIHWRDIVESEKLKKDKDFNIDLVQFRDSLFSDLIAFINNLKSNFNKDNSSANNVTFTEYEVRQIEELWGFWLKKQSKLMQLKSNLKLDEIDKQNLELEKINIKKAVLNNFAEFKNFIIKEIEANNLLKNPSYLSIKGFNLKSTSILDTALKTDKVYSFLANYYKARVLIGKISQYDHEDKDEVLLINDAVVKSYNNLQDAKHKIESFLIPQLRDIQSYYAIFDVLRNEDQLSKQINVKVKLFNKHVEFIDKALKVLNSSQEGSLFRVSVKVPILDAMGGDKAVEDEVNELNEFGLVNFFEIEAYLPDDDDDGFLDNLFVFVSGVVQIAAGLALAAATGGFGLSFGIGMITSGISDIITSLTTDKIDLNNYFKGKIIEYGINALLSGISSVQSSFSKDAVKQVGKEAGKEAVKPVTLQTAVQSGKSEVIQGALKQEFIKQGVVKGLNYVFDVALNDVLEDHQEEIENSVRKSIANLLNIHKNDLIMMMAADKVSLNSENQSLLRHLAINILQQYQSKFHSVGLDIARGVLAKSSNAYLSIGSKIIDFSISLDRILETTDMFCNKLEEKILQIIAKLPTPSESLQKQLSRLSFSTEQSKEIIVIMTNNNLIVNSQIVANQCDKVQSLTLPSNYAAVNRFKIIKPCNRIDKIYQEDYTNLINGLINSLTDILTHSIMSMVRNELLKPISSMAASWGGEHLMQAYANAQREALKQIYETLGNNEETKESSKAANDNEKTPSANSNYFSQENLKEVEKLADKIITSKGGMVEAKILSKYLNRPVHLFRDGKLIAGYGNDLKNPSGAIIKINYYSANNKWAVVGTHLRFDSIYESVGHKIGENAFDVREGVKDYLKHSPAFAYELISQTNTKDYSSLFNKFPEQPASSQDHKQKAPVYKPLKPTIKNQESLPQSKEVYGPVYQGGLNDNGHPSGGKPSSNDNVHPELEKYFKLVPKDKINPQELNILKDATYKTSEEEINKHLIKNNLNGYKIEIRSGEGDDKLGFFGALYSKTLPTGEKIYIEVHKGTDFPNWKEPASLIQFLRDIVKDDHHLLLSKMPEQLKSAERFHMQVIDYIGANKSLYVTGHSLGGSVAQLMGAKYINDYTAIIDFDGPGIKEVIDTYMPNVNLEKLKQKTILFKGMPHRINSLGTHIVDPIIVDHLGNKIPIGYRQGVSSLEAMIAEYSLSVHSSESITAGFNENGPIKIINVKEWPVGTGLKSTDSQIAFFFDYDNNREAWDTLFKEEYDSNTRVPYKSPFVPTKPAQEVYTFDEYKSYRINVLKEYRDNLLKHKAQSNK